MKNLCSLLIVSVLLLIGCSSTHTIKDFPSKEKFYQDFNNSAKNKDVKIILINDSSFAINDGIALENDTLFSYVILEGKDSRSFALSEIIEIKYTNNDYKSASVLFKNGDKLIGEDIRTNRDSIYFVTMKKLLTINNIIPINKVKTISYKNRLVRIPLGILAGGVTGLVSGIFYASSPHPSQDNAGLISGSIIGGALIGVLIGSIVSYRIGYNYYYQFNP
jgi:hypothetical protein